MKASRLTILACAAVAAIGTAAISQTAGQAQQSDPAMWSREEKEQFLLTAKVVKTRGISEGVTNSQRATLESERGIHDAHIQTIDEYKAKFESATGGSEMNFKDTYKFNLAAYLLERTLDLNMIPVTVERSVGGHHASVTWWIDNVLMDEKERLRRKEDPPEAVRDKWNRQMYIVRVFDQLIYNTDRNLGNILITKNWNIWMIDHTRGFRTYKELPDPKNLVKCDRELLKGLRELNKQTLKEKLGKYLSGMEIDGLLGRRDKIVKFFDDKIARDGEAAVLYDYLAERRTTAQGEL
jgi:hypothetical protein